VSKSLPSGTFILLEHFSTVVKLRQGFFNIIAKKSHTSTGNTVEILAAKYSTAFAQKVEVVGLIWTDEDKFFHNPLVIIRKIW
jgi:hypothetical protein